MRRLQAMETINYDKSRIDFLYDFLEKFMENEEHVEIILDRLKSLEKIHTESPTIDGSIKTLRERQKLIDRAFANEDAEILRQRSSSSTQWDPYRRNSRRSRCCKRLQARKKRIEGARRYLSVRRVSSV